MNQKVEQYIYKVCLSQTILLASMYNLMYCLWMLQGMNLAFHGRNMIWGLLLAFNVFLALGYVLAKHSYECFKKECRFAQVDQRVLVQEDSYTKVGKSGVYLGTHYLVYKHGFRIRVVVKEESLRMRVLKETMRGTYVQLYAPNRKMVYKVFFDHVHAKEAMDCLVAWKNAVVCDVVTWEDLPDSKYFVRLEELGFVPADMAGIDALVSRQVLPKSKSDHAILMKVLVVSIVCVVTWILKNL